MPDAGPFRPALDAAVAQVAVEVDRDTVLRARTALLAEAHRLRRMLCVKWGTWPGVGRCGRDPVSADAEAALTERVQGLIEGCHRYCDDLEQAAHKLDQTARRYGYTEQEIADSFRAMP